MSSAASAASTPCAKPLKRLSSSSPHSTGLKPGANERHATKCEICRLNLMPFGNSNWRRINGETQPRWGWSSFGSLPRVARKLATLGFGTESRWDSGWEFPKGIKAKPASTCPFLCPLAVFPLCLLRFTSGSTPDEIVCRQARDLNQPGDCPPCQTVAHSCRKAWIGSSFAARCAGSKPATRPMKVANRITPSARVRLTTKKSPRMGSSR